MGCKLTSNIQNQSCEYQVAGIRSIRLVNFDSNNVFEFEAAIDGSPITAITLADGSKAYEIDFNPDSASWTDDLAVNGNGGKYRTHTLNFTIGKYDDNILNQSKALSLSKFTAFVTDKQGKTIVLGRTNGLSATSHNYASGAAVSDANGWTVVLAGTEIEEGRLLANESLVKDLVDKVVIVA